MKTFKEQIQEVYGRRHDAYTRDYHSSISGMGKHQSHAYHADGGANDEGWDREHHHKPADHPHSVHINGKKWKTFGSHSHATNVARKIKGATVHREEVQIQEEKHRVQVTISDPNHSAVTKRKEQIQKHIRVTAADKESAVERAKSHYKKAGYKVHSAEHVGMVQESTDMCNVCGQTPCNCTHITEESDAYAKAEENKRSADSAKKQGDMFAHHLHMADHHDNMAQWHGEKGRHGEADRHAEKSEQHHELAMKHKDSVKEEVEHITELTSELLARYKEKAAAAASAADKAKKYDLGHKRFKGIIKATFKQFANDAKK